MSNNQLNQCQSVYRCFDGQYTMTMTYPNGNKYEGEWKDGMMHGKGVLTDLDGNKYEGEWEKGEMHGTGKMTYKNGDI